MKAFFQFAALGLLSFASGYGLAIIPWSSTNTPAWVQAIGSIIAIGIAIWVPYWQQRSSIRHAAAAEKARTKQLLSSLNDEMSIVVSGFNTRNGALLLGLQSGEFFRYIVPATEHPFPIYSACVNRLGEIPDPVLRQKIVVGYTKAMSFVQSMRLNNTFVAKIEECGYLADKFNDDLHRNHLAGRIQIAVEYAAALRAAYIEAMASIQELVDALNLELAN